MSGITYGPGDSGEPATSVVCAHQMPVGWACAGCASDDGRSFGTAPARPHHVNWRAVCQCCGNRHWTTVAPDGVEYVLDAHLGRCERCVRSMRTVTRDGTNLCVACLAAVLLP